MSTNSLVFYVKVSTFKFVFLPTNMTNSRHNQTHKSPVCMFGLSFFMQQIPPVISAFICMKAVDCAPLWLHYYYFFFGHVSPFCCCCVTLVLFYETGLLWLFNTFPIIYKPFTVFFTALYLWSLDAISPFKSNWTIQMYKDMVRI